MADQPIRGSTPQTARTSRRRFVDGRTGTTRSFALVCDDPDVPMPGGFVHWVVYNVPSTATGVPENLPIDPAGADAGAIAGTVQGRVGFKRPISRARAATGQAASLSLHGLRARRHRLAPGLTRGGARRGDAGPHRRAGRTGRHLRAQAARSPPAREDAMADAPLTRRDLLNVRRRRRRAAATGAPEAQAAFAKPATSATRPRAARALTASRGRPARSHRRPADPVRRHGPGATEAMAVRYIDRAAGRRSAGSARRLSRRSRSPGARYARQGRAGAVPRSSTETRQISLLIDVESGTATGANVGFAGSSAQFFALVRGHVMQGTLRRSALRRQRGLRRLGSARLPGVRTVVTPAEQKLLSPPTRVRRSAYENPMFNKAIVRREAGRERSRCRLTSPVPMWW